VARIARHLTPHAAFTFLPNRIAGKREGGVTRFRSL